jgi:hypothetical protein
MKKVLSVLLILAFAPTASAAIYKWVDRGGVVNFVDDYSKVPYDYRDEVKEINIPKLVPSTPSQAPPGKTITGARSGEEMAKQPPPIAQPLTREGDFAIKLAEALKLGRVESEAEAESLLASVGIAPKNGWIADYPMTPDIIGELEKTVSEAADAKRLPMGKNDALKAFRMTAVELELPIIAEVPERYTESPPPSAPEYMAPSVINNYYYAEGPPVVTYYPPPWDYYYMYAWIPSPFWYSGFYFPGYFILHDFHRVIHGYWHGHRHAHLVTNHTRDSRTGRIYAIDPTRRNSGRISAGLGSSPTRGFNSTEARHGAQSILERSRERVSSRTTSMPITGRGTYNRTPAYVNSGRNNEKQVYNKRDMSSGFNDKNNIYTRPPSIDRRMNRIPSQSSPGMSNRTLSRPESTNRQYGVNSKRPFVGETQSSNSSSRWSERSFSPSPQSGNQPFNSPTGSRGLSGSPQRSNHGGRFGQSGGQYNGSSSAGGGGFSGSRQSGSRGSPFSLGSPRF